MVLLPDPSKYKPNVELPKDEKRSIFFENQDLEQMARHFIGNNSR